jgi:hypothetical protein
MHLGSLISTEESLRGGGDVNPGDTMMKDGVSGNDWMEGSMGHFRASESLDPEALFTSTTFGTTFTS